MKCRRLTAAVLSAAMMVPFMPLHFTVNAAGNVSYNRKNPEVAIFNAYTGASHEFYNNNIRKDSPYNAAALFKNGDKVLDFNSKVHGETYTYDIKDTTLNAVRQPYSNLKTGASGSFVNNHHKHSWKTGLFSKSTANVISYSSLYYEACGYNPTRIVGSWYSKYSRFRAGNYEFSDINYDLSRTDMQLRFLNSEYKYDYGNRTCTCGGHSVSEIVVGFKDDRSPKLKAIGGNIKDGVFKAGDTINVEITYDEPIRFADDSANHDDLYVNLAINGYSADRYPKAMLTKLDNDTLYFSYNVPSDETDTEKTITGIDISPLVQECTLVQVKGSDSFTVSKPSDAASDMGFTKAESYITDLAGNGIEKNVYNINAYIDTKKPEIAQIGVRTFPNNSDVKEMLGKTDSSDPSYPDASDKNFGVNDYIYFDLKMTEVLDIDSGYATAYEDLEVETNLRRSDGSVVTLNSRYAPAVTTPRDDIGLGASKGTVTDFLLSYLFIEDGMTCVDDDQRIRLTKLKFKGDVYDLAGNKLEQLDIPEELNTSTCYLDVTPPEITTTAQTDENGIYKVTPEGNGFVFQFEVSDNSGTNGLYGGFSWKQTGDFNSAFEYAVTTGNEEPQWQEGSMGSYYTFEQVESDQQYLHIRPKDGEIYSVTGTTLCFYGSDYAGNGHMKQNTEPVKFNIDAVWDNMPPTAVVGAIKRELSENGGTLSVNVELSDKDLLNDAFYLWNDGETPELTDISEVPTENIINQQTGTITAKADVGQGENYIKHLWVKVSDRSGNEQMYYIGEFTYNLTSLKYALSYSKKPSKYLQMNIDDIEDGGYLMFMLPSPDVNNQYYVYSGNFSGGGHINVGPDGWYKVTDTTADKRNFTPEDLTDIDKEYLSYVLQGQYYDKYGYRNGNFNIHVISGRTGAFTFDGNGRVTAAGTESFNVGEETITMRLVTSDNNGSDIYEGRSLTTSDHIPALKTNSSYIYPQDERQLSTLAGLTFQVNFGQDIYGWNNEDINYDDSYLNLNCYNGSVSTNYKIELKPQQIQSVVLPDLDYVPGRYIVTLYVKSYAGREYSVSYGTNIYVDTTPAYNDFELEKVTYSPIYSDRYYNHGIGEQSYTYDGECMYLPVINGTNKLVLKMDEQYVYENGIYTGRDTLVWNVTAGQTVDTASYPVGKELKINIVKDKSEAEAEIDSGSGRDIPLCLIENTVNTIAVQVMQSNGKDSEIKYYNIYPVNQYVNGTVSATMHENGGYVVDSGDLIFTPAENQSMDGIKVYSVYSDSNGESHKQELLPKEDGIFRHPLSPGKNAYYLHTIDKYGNVSLIGYSQGSSSNTVYLDPWYYTTLDNEAPVITPTSKSSSDGSFVAKFRVDDATLSSHNIDMPISARFYFDDDYSNRLGISAGQSLDVEFDTFENHYDDSRTYIGKISTWEAETTSNTGIYKVTAFKPQNEQNMEVTVYGVVKYDETADDTVNFKLNMDATDEFGFTGTNSVDINGKNVKPYVLTDNSNKPQYLQIDDAYDYALQVKFNVPVQPKKSWIMPNPTGYSDTWSDAFPITNDGTWTVEFYDIFGDIISQEITLTDTFNSYGLDISITPTELTGENVELSAKTNAENTEGAILLWEKISDTSITLLSTGDGTPRIPKPYKDASIDQNKVVIVYLYDRVYSDDELYSQGYYRRGDQLVIHIDNIGKEAPYADPRFYLEQYGQEYTEDDLRSAFPGGVETTGKVEVWYETSRHVTSINDTGDRVTFKYGDNPNHKFEYEDDLGNVGSWEFSLSDYGITLTTPPEPPKDEKSPDVAVDIYAKTFGNYKSADGFTADATQTLIGNTFENVGYVQDYSMKIKAYDDSSYKIVLLSSPPSNLSYASATSDTINGVKLSGNTVTITKDVDSDFTVAVVDNAADETGASSDNFTYFTIRKSDIEKWFDNTKPEAVKTTVQNGLYEQTVYLTFNDKTDSGEKLSADSVTLSSPKLEKETDGTYAGQYKKVFTDNISENVVFYDLVGNMGDTTSIGVSGIDTEPPKLEITWTPPYVTPEGNVDITSFNLGPINTSVYAHISAGKSIDVQNVSVTGYTLNGTDWIDIPSGNIYDVPFKDVSYTVNTQQVDVCFADGGIGLRFNIPAPNGKSSTAEVYLPQGVIDKAIPGIKQEEEKLMRPGATVPYGIRVTLTPNEGVYCSSYGEAETIYDEISPLKMTMFENGTHNFVFADKAGNHAAVSLDITGIDNKAPVLSFTPNLSEVPITSTEQTVTVTTDEACRLTFNGEMFELESGEGKELSFTENGVYTVIATDAAGNESILNIPVGNIDKTPPNISFNKSNIRVRQDSSMDDLKAALNEGVTVWDPYNDTAPTWKYESDTDGNPLVDISAIGIYRVVYTVTDAVGNIAQRTRYVSVYDKAQPGVYIDGEYAEAEGTMVIAKGDHVLTVHNIQEIAPGVLEPYTLKIKRGISTIGQMKYGASDIEVAEDGSFNIAPGFYTLSIITQSRKTFRTTLYVEK